MKAKRRKMRQELDWTKLRRGDLKLGNKLCVQRKFPMKLTSELVIAVTDFVQEKEQPVWQEDDNEYEPRKRELN